MKPYAPLGILYLCSHLRNQGFDVEVFDTTFSNRGALFQHLRTETPSVVGIYANLMTRGNVVEILPAARRVTYRGAVVGIRARGVVRGEVPHTSIEAMAADYLREIKKRQPNGPYYLCGYSSGGIVAFEIARRLSESGDEVGFAGLFDTTMSPVRWPLRAWLSIIARRIALLAAAVRATPIRGWRATLRKSAERLRAWRGTLGAAPSIAVRVAASALIASAKYHPAFYRGQLTLFSPAEREPGLPSLESVWRKHTQTVVVVETAGAHATMLSTLHAETTAACLTRCLPAASPVRPHNRQH